MGQNPNNIGINELSDENGISLLVQVKEALKHSIIKGDFEIPMLPHVAQQVLQRLNEPNLGFPELEGLVKQDQALAARVIKTANSAYYRGVHEVTNVSTAMSRIGLRAMKDIVISLGMQSTTFSVPGFEETLEAVWDHSIACAAISQDLARQLGQDTDSAFLAGLLHDIGKPVIVLICCRLEAQQAKKLKLSVSESLKFKLPTLREEVIPQAFEEYHTAVGTAVARRWNLSALIVDVVQNHHDYAKADKSFRKMCAIVNMANVLCHHAGLGCEAEKQNVLDHPCFLEFGLSQEQIKPIVENALIAGKKFMGFPF